MSKITVKTADDLSPDDIQAQIDAKVSSANKPAKATKVSKPKTAAKPAKAATKPATAKVVVDKPTEPAVISHRGKMLKPADEHKVEAVKEEEPPKATSEAGKTETKVEPVTPAPKPEAKEPEKPAPAPEPSPESKPAPAPEPVTEEKPPVEDLGQRDVDQPTPDPTQIKKAEAQQQPQIFDTKQYHLPIKATKHHRRGGPSTLSYLFLIMLVAAALAYAAADLGWYDPGFELPYDLF